MPLAPPAPLFGSIALYSLSQCLGLCDEVFGRPYCLADELNLRLNCETGGNSFPEYPNPGASSVRIGRTSRLASSSALFGRQDRLGEVEAELAFVFIGLAGLLHTKRLLADRVKESSALHLGMPTQVFPHLLLSRLHLCRGLLPRDGPRRGIA